MVIDYGKLIYGDVDSSDYGIYISGEGVYNAPERAVEFVNVPGRNGAIALDQGRYENIQVTYPAMVLENDQESFRERLGRFRNAILSQKGYQRLEDSYHPEEYRMGVYTSGLEVKDLLTFHQGGNFELTFDCKPQRWLTVGDYPIPVESGDVLDNPTLFDAGPLLEIEGYGAIAFNGYAVSLENAVLGVTELVHPTNVIEYDSIISNIYFIDRSLYNVGDTITIPSFTFNFFVGSGPKAYSSVTYAIDSSSTVTPTVDVPFGGNSVPVNVTFPTITQSALDSDDDPVVYKAQVNITATIAQIDGGGTHTFSNLASITFHPRYIQVVMSGTKPSDTHREDSYHLPQITVDSTLSILGNPTYIDCEMGEAYRMVDGTPVSLNSKVALGSDLPVLAPGPNKVTFSNTISDLKIAPRWWKV